MKSFIRSFLPQWAINYFYHFPLAILANFFYGFPTRKLKVIGVTGTDGKTTTVNMIYKILKDAGKKVSMVSSINAVIGGKNFDTGFHVSSPDPFTVQKFAKDALEIGDEYLILEVTSHGIDQYRFWGVNFEVGIITNITHDHLDYHKTLKQYSETKLKLIKNSEISVINQYIQRSWKLLDKKKIYTFGLQKGDFNQKEIKLSLKVPGDYNLENALAALACAFVLNIDRKVAQKALEQFHGIVGRMESVENNKGVKIFIDFASTPNALEQALRTLKPEKGKLWAVFGSAGKRDVKKRKMMGEIVARLADMVIITAEDPRGELEKISQEIANGATKQGARLDRNLFIIDDRQKAIEFAILNSRRGDVVGIFGKGHESSMNLDGKSEIPWSDQEAVRKVLYG